MEVCKKFRKRLRKVMGIESRIRLAIKLRFPELVDDEGANAINVFVNGEPCEITLRFLTEELYLKIVSFLKRAYPEDLIEAFPEKAFDITGPKVGLKNYNPLGTPMLRNITDTYERYFRSRV